MTDSSQPLKAYWPSVMVATFVIAVLPALAVSAMQATGALSSTLPSIAVAAALSLGASAAGSSFWARRPGSRDVVFADLMVWGWVRRLRTERRLADAKDLLGGRSALSSSGQVELFERLSAALEARDPYTHGHSRRVARYSERIALRMGLTRAKVAKIRTAAAVHDVGKLNTPREVLNKAGKLTDEEFASIRLHPEDGAELVASMGDPELTAMVRHHHERLDGRGYPDGLEAAEISVGARIIAVADTFDAITSTRSYRQGCKHMRALDVLKEQAGSQLDPDAVEAFVSYYSGRRSAAWSSVLVAEPARLVSALLGWLPGAGTAPIAKVVAAAGAAALIGSSLASAPAQEGGHRSKVAAAATLANQADRGGYGRNATRPLAARRPQAPSSRRSRSGSDEQGAGSGPGGFDKGGSRSESAGGGSESSDSGRQSVGSGTGGGGSGDPAPRSDGSPTTPAPTNSPLPEVEAPEFPATSGGGSTPGVSIPGGDSVPGVSIPGGGSVPSLPVEPKPVGLPRLLGD